MSGKPDVKDADFFVVRHGETSLNKNDLARGWSNSDSAALDKKGVRQAKLAAIYLSKLPVKFGLIVSSDLDRTLHTAAIVAKQLGIKDIYSDARLRPINVGKFTGEKKSKIDFNHYITHPDISFPGGESINEFRARQKDFYIDLSKWIKDNPDEKAIEVAHLSQVVYWQDMENSIRGYLEHYNTTKKDLIHPGGIIAVMPDNEVIPLLGENKKFNPSDKGEE